VIAFIRQVFDHGAAAVNDRGYRAPRRLAAKLARRRVLLMVPSR
jgi:hypothetical protein